MTAVEVAAAAAVCTRGEACGNISCSTGVNKLRQFDFCLLLKLVWCTGEPSWLFIVILTSGTEHRCSSVSIAAKTFELRPTLEPFGHP